MQLVLYRSLCNFSVVKKLVKCPLCGKAFEGKPLKEWKFRFYDVKRYECEKCGSRFNVYESQNSMFTIPKAKR